MKLLYLILTILFTCLTFAGAGYVLFLRGHANAGYAVVPLVFTLACLQGYRNAKQNINR